MIKKNMIIGLFIISILILISGCVSEYDIEPFVGADQPPPRPTEKPTAEITEKPTSTPTQAPKVSEKYDDEQFLTWLSNSMKQMSDQTLITNRAGNWGKTLKEDAREDQAELERFRVSPKYQKIAELYGNTLYAYELAGYHAEDGSTRTEGVPNTDKTLSCLNYSEFQLGVIDALLKSDTMTLNGPFIYTVDMWVYNFFPPMDLKIAAGTTVRWRNTELRRNPRTVISEDGLWAEPITLTYLKYHEYKFNEPGTFSFSIKGNEDPSRRKITVI